MLAVTEVQLLLKQELVVVEKLRSELLAKPFLVSSVECFCRREFVLCCWSMIDDGTGELRLMDGALDSKP